MMMPFDSIPFPSALFFILKKREGRRRVDATERLNRGIKKQHSHLAWFHIGSISAGYLDPCVHAFNNPSEFLDHRDQLRENEQRWFYEYFTMHHITIISAEIIVVKKLYNPYDRRHHHHYCYYYYGCHRAIVFFLVVSIREYFYLVHTQPRKNRNSSMHFSWCDCILTLLKYQTCLDCVHSRVIFCMCVTFACSVKLLHCGAPF